MLAEHLSKSSQPLVPQQVFTAGGGGSGSGDSSGLGLMGTLVNLLIAEKSGFRIQGAAGNGNAELTRATAVAPDSALVAPKIEARKS